MVEVKFVGTASECRDEMRALLGTGTAVVENAKPAASAPKAEKGSKKEMIPAPLPVEEAKAPETTQATGARKIEDISAKVAELLSKHPRAKVVEFLASFGVKKGSDLPQDKWADFLTKADALQ